MNYVLASLVESSWPRKGVTVMMMHTKLIKFKVDAQWLEIEILPGSDLVPIMMQTKLNHEIVNLGKKL